MSIRKSYLRGKHLVMTCALYLGAAFDLVKNSRNHLDSSTSVAEHNDVLAREVKSCWILASRNDFALEGVFAGNLKVLWFNLMADCSYEHLAFLEKCFTSDNMLELD
jgi:hypothetical protein